MTQAAAPPKPGTNVQWTRCPACDAFVYYKRLQRNLGVCPECNYHFRIPVATRLEQLLDEGSFEDLSGDLEPLDALGFADSKPYSQRIDEARHAPVDGDPLVHGRALVRHDHDRPAFQPRGQQLQPFLWARWPA